METKNAWGGGELTYNTPTRATISYNKIHVLQSTYKYLKVFISTITTLRYIQQT